MCNAIVDDAAFPLTHKNRVSMGTSWFYECLTFSIASISELEGKRCWLRSHHYPKNIDGNITHCAVCQVIGDQRFSWNHRLSFHSDLINGRFSFLSNSATVPLRHTRPAEMKWVLKFPAGHFMIPIHISHRGFEARRDRTTQGIWLWSFDIWSLKPWLLFWVWAFNLPIGSEYPWSNRQSS